MSYFRYNNPYSVSLGPRAHSFLEYPPVPIRPMGSFIDAAGVSATTGSQALDNIIKWGFWIGMGLVGYRMYRVLRYNDPLIQPRYKLPPAWQANAPWWQPSAWEENPRRTKAEMERILESVRGLHDSGATVYEMSEQLGVSKRTVYNYLRRLGLETFRRRPELEYTRKRALELYEPRMNLLDLAHLLDVSPGTLRIWLIKEGVYVPRHQGPARGESMSRSYMEYYHRELDRERERARKKELFPDWEPVDKNYWLMNPGGLVRQCAWCRRVWKDGRWQNVSLEPGVPVTHGVCEECNAEIEAQMQEIEQQEEMERRARRSR